MSKRRQQEILYAYNLPQELIESLEPVEKETEELLEEKESDYDTVNALALERLQIQQERLNNGDSLTCNTCCISFSEREDQRNHFNTDWHRYNIKRKVVLDVQPVTFEEFEVLLAGNIHTLKCYLYSLKY
jgi:riboflavin synthase alpha subunit